jgi:ATP-dependent helicase/nuclease subunit A
LALLRQPAVLTRATARYHFFLVDEFQDTNAVQRELMHQLALSSSAAQANLFIVGDRKQSIYGFRGADVDVFQQMTRALKEAGGTEQPLHLNFRSQPALINFFNHLFSRLFQLEEQLSSAELSELGFVEFEASNQQREQVDEGPLVELLIDTKSPDDDDPKASQTAAERDARQVAQRILSLTNPGADSHREFRDIALLFRAMTDVQTYESVLRSANIPFQTVQGKGFYEREEISDLIQLLRFLDNKTDELALAAVLRSPLGGVSDNALLALRSAPSIKYAAGDQTPALLSQPRRMFSALRRHNEIAYISDEDHAQLERAKSLLSKLIERRNHSPLADLLRFAVDESEYLSVIAANFDGAQRLANVQKLFNLAERFEHSGAYLIRDLVRYVEEFEQIGSREAEGQIDDSANAVRLMTIHQAKGLEFPVVIIPDLHRLLRSPEHWFVLDRYRGLTVKVPDGRGKQVTGCTFEKFRDRSKLREQFESIRLLYVAATRAEDRLILAGATEELAGLNGSPDNWLKLIWQKLELQVSESGVINPGKDVALEVKLNLADQPIAATPSTVKVPEERNDQIGSLVAEFPLIQPMEAETAGGHRFSVTQLINYRRCPRQYYFDRILHVPSADEIAVWNDAEAPEPPANMTATLKGAVIHRFCETYGLGDNPEDRLRQSFAEVIDNRRAQLSDRLLDINTEEAIKELWPLAQNYLSSNLFQRVREAQESATALTASSPRTDAGIWSELSFRLRRPLGFITGTIDKLLVTRVSGSANVAAVSQAASHDVQAGEIEGLATSESEFEVEIIDFKTNRFIVAPAEAPQNLIKESVVLSPLTSARLRGKRSRAKQTTVNQFAFDFSANTAVTKASALTLDEQVRLAADDYQLQMQAYALAVRELLPELSKSGRIKVTLHFLQPNIEVQLPRELLGADVCAQAIDNAMLKIILATEPIHFAAYPQAHCRMCSFLDVCRPGREWVKKSRASIASKV